MNTLRFNNKYRIPSTRLQHWNYANEAMYFVTICTQNRANYFGDIVDTPIAVEPQCLAAVGTQCLAAVGTQCLAAVGTQCLAAVGTQCLAAVGTQCPAEGGTQCPAEGGTRVETRGIASLRPTEIGKIAHLEWYKSVELRPDMNLELGEFIVMPNHIHGIVIIGANEYNAQGDARRDAMPCVSTDARMEGDARRDARMEGDARRDARHRVSTDANKYQNQFAPQSKNLASILRGYKSAVTTYARKNNIEFDWQPRFYDHIIRSMDDYHRIAHYIINNPAKWQADKFYLS